MKKIELTKFQNKKENDINQLRIKAAQEVEEISEILGVWIENSPWSKFMGLENLEKITNRKNKFFANISNFWWDHMNYEKHYWEKRDSGYFGLGSPTKTRSSNEKVRERLEILLFNQELFSTAKEIENNVLAKVMAEIYQKREEKIENFVWETKKRIELEKVEDMLSLKEEIVELSKKVRNHERDGICVNLSFIEAAQNYTNLRTEKECLTAQLASKTRECNELTAKIHMQEGEIIELKKSLSRQDEVRAEQENKFASIEKELRKKEIQSKSWYQLNTAAGKFFWGTNLAWIAAVSIWAFVVWKREKRTKERT